MIRIYKNPNGDTRTAPKNINFEQFQEANDMHIQDVRSVMNKIAIAVMLAGENHDFTKKTSENLFYNNFISTMKKGTDFVSDEWYQKHIASERHHLLSRCPEDVNLIDVLEMIVDCVCSGKARSGDVREIEINQEILKKALDNTVTLVNDITKVY